MKTDHRRCFICGTPLGEEERTICDGCIDNQDSYDMYKMEFARLMETA